MPNHVTNKLEFQGDPERIAALVKRFGTQHEHEPELDWSGNLMFRSKESIQKVGYMNPETKEFTVFDCSKSPRERAPTEYKPEEWYQQFLEPWHHFPNFELVFPMPDCLDITSGSIGELGYAHLTGKAINPFSDPYQLQLHFKKLDEERKKEALKLGRQYKENVERHGHTSWYSWHCEHWGTKWNSYDCEERDGAYYFDTAWSPPEPIMQKISEVFPDVKITHSFFDEGWCFWGKAEWLGGKLNIIHQNDRDLKDDPLGIELCKDLKGYDPLDDIEEEEIVAENEAEPKKVELDPDEILNSVIDEHLEALVAAGKEETSE